MGYNGLPWKESLEQLCELGLKEDVQRNLMRNNAVDLFKLKVASASNPNAEIVPAGLSENVSRVSLS